MSINKTKTQTAKTKPQKANLDWLKDGSITQKMIEIWANGAPHDSSNSPSGNGSGSGSGSGNGNPNPNPNPSPIAPATLLEEIVGNLIEEAKTSTDEPKSKENPRHPTQ